MRTPIQILILGLFAILHSPPGSAGDLLDNWTWRNPLPSGENLAAVAYGNGIFAAVGQSGTVCTSTDGIAWTHRTVGSEYPLAAITFGNGQFIALSGSTVHTSMDGITWTTRPTAAEFNPFCVAYGSGRYVAVGGGGIFAVSTNGTDWVNAGTLPGFSLPAMSVTFANNLFVAVGLQGRIATSPDGLTWTPRASGTSGALTSVAFGGGLFVAVGGSALEHGIIRTSPDGVTWTSRSSGTGNNFGAVAYHQGRFVALGDYRLVRWSSNGITWNPGSMPGSIPTSVLVRGTVGANGLLVAVGTEGVLLTSTDGSVWTNRAAGLRTGNNFTGAVHGDGQFVVVGGGETNAAIVTSPDGYTWTRRDPGAGVSFLYNVCHGQNQFVAVGAAGRIVTSSNGVAWTSRASGTSLDLLSVAHGGGVFVACGNNGSGTQRTILTSSNASQWTVRVSESGPPLESVAYGAGLFVVVGGNGTIRTSTNGVQWVTRTSGTTEPLWDIAFGNGRFVAVTPYLPSMLVSTDGVAWTPWGGENYFGAYSITYGNGLFVAGGNGLIYTSTTGTNWTSRGYGTMIEEWGLTHGAGQFLLVGTLSSILGCDIRPRLGPLTRLPTGGVEFPLEGVSSLRYTLEASTNLTDWSVLGNTIATNGLGRFTDASSTGSSPRFYRSVSQP